MTMRIASVAKAEAWRAKSGQHFRSTDLAGEAKLVGKIPGACTSPLDENEIDPRGSHPAAKLYRALKDTVLGESQPFSSVALGQDNPEEEEGSWRALEPPTVSESKTPMIHESKDTLAEYLRASQTTSARSYSTPAGNTDVCSTKFIRAVLEVTCIALT